MRKRFEQQISMGRLLIEDTIIPTTKRIGALPGLCAALKELFVNPEWNQRVFELLESRILPKNNKTGRPGMDLWQVFVLSQVRLCQNISYDELHYLANYDSLVRQIMGVELSWKSNNEPIGYQCIIDNVSLLDDELVKELNDVIVAFGHEVFKKKDEEALRLKTDSFVVESNVHFPTDYNLLWDSARKCLDMITKLSDKQDLPGWRKIANWRKELKNKMRVLGQACSSGGKGRNERIRLAADTYLQKAKALLDKLQETADTVVITDLASAIIFMQLKEFIQLLVKHIDLLERRLIKEEQIPHQEKMFSIFEQYTEWVTKGKLRPNVELGKKTAVTTDQYNLIVDYRVMESESDSQIVAGLVERVCTTHKVGSWSFDKGFWHKDNKELLSQKVDTVVLPKKGKPNKSEAEAEGKPLFKKLRNKHSAVESNINELGHRGLDRCPDKGYGHFKRYIGLSVCAYNLKKTGEQLLTLQRKKQISQERKLAA